jgi:hypothetical protein
MLGDAAMTMDDDDYIEIAEVIQYTVTCSRCRIRIKMTDIDRMTAWIRHHREDVHDARQRG